MRNSEHLAEAARGKTVTVEYPWGASEVPLVGAGAPYRVLDILSSDRDDFPPRKCDHCGIILNQKQVTISDKEGGEFVVGSSCAKNIGGEKLARAVKALDDQEAQEAVTKLFRLKWDVLSGLPWEDVPPDLEIPPVKKYAISRQRSHDTKPLTAAAFANVLLNNFAFLNPKRRAMFADYLKKL